MVDKFKAGLIQMSSTNQVAENMDAAESLIRKGRSNAGGGKSNRAGASPAKTAPASKTPDKKTDNGYKKSQRRDMQQLLESATGKQPQ